MKKAIVFIVFNLFFLFSLNAQTITYKANKWGNTKLYGKWTRALDNPVIEKVVIVQTDKTIQVTFGKRTMIYSIINSELTDASTTRYDVKMNNKNYSIKRMLVENAYYFICENEWAVAEITDIASSE